MKVLKQKNTSEKFITNAEAYLTRQISKMEPFGLTVFTKKSIIDFRLGSKYASVMEEETFSKFSQKITILKYSFSKVVALKKSAILIFV